MSQHVPTPATATDPGAQPELAAITHAQASRRGANRRGPRGQVLIIFAFMLTILLGAAAFVVDLAWIWSNQLQVQRAADAGALAGVVHLPNDPDGARAAAWAEARKNGYTDEVNAEIVANPDPSFSRRMVVTVSSPVETFFMGLFGWHEVNVTRTARAEYILPVPMGSPQNYLGVGRLVKSVFGSTEATDWTTPDATGDPSNWCNDSASSVSSDNNTYAGENGSNGSCPNPPGGGGSNPNGTTAAWRDFDINDEDIPNDAEIRGLEVEIRGRATSGQCRISVELSRDADEDDNWTTSGHTVPTAPAVLAVGAGSGSDQTYTVGGAADLWGRTWTLGQLESQNFGIRLGRINVSGCGTVLVDRIRIRVHFAVATDQPVAVTAPNGQALVPQNFWLGLQSQGSPSVQGDAYMTKYTTRKSSTNPNYCPWRGACASNPEGLYNYAIELPDGGNIYIFDPGFCDGTGSRGTGEYWTIGGSNGADTPQPVSAFYRLYNTANTAWDFTDDPRVDLGVAGQNGTAVPGFPNDPQPITWRRGANSSGAKYYDSSLRNEPNEGSGYSDCDGLSWHHGWWQIGVNLPAGTYRLHTTSHDLISTNDQNDTTALNSFAIWAIGPSGPTNVRVYGLGAMESYFPLPAAQSSQFYLAQIEAVHANKWVDISLWDPGDTGALPANLSILMPKAPGGSMPTGVPNCANASYCPVPFYWNAVSGTTMPTDFTCGPDTSSSTTSIPTSGGSGGIYNGRWLRLCFQLPPDWTAPIPQPDGLTPTGGQGGGWFRIQYSMGGSAGSQPSTDLTTWKVEVRGNPVHLITPREDIGVPVP